MKIDDIERMLQQGGIGFALVASRIPEVQQYVAYRMQEEQHEARLAVVMTCYGMSHADGMRYAREAMQFAGYENAYDAACAGRPFLLPWRGLA